MTAKRKNPSYKLKVQLLQEVQLKCPFCGYREADKLEHHHIDGNPNNTIFENLISVCPNCHAGIESGQISTERVKTLKKSLISKNSYFNKGDYEFTNYLLHQERVGIFKKGMTINEVYNILPKKQVKKVIIYGEHTGEDIYDAYEIYDADGSHILTLEPTLGGNIESKIEAIHIKSKKFSSNSGVHIGATIREIKKTELVEKFEPDIEHIHFNIDWLSAWCSIPKKELENEWWNDRTKSVFIEGENLNAKVEELIVRWY